MKSEWEEVRAKLIAELIDEDSAPRTSKKTKKKGKN
jgi:hypothetical protein